MQAWRSIATVYVGLLLLPAAARTAAADKPLCRIAFGSCLHEDKPQPIWEAILATKPDLFLFLGDNIYGDTTDMAVLRAKYGKLAAVAEYQKLLRTCPLLATWDDHDYGANDAGAEYSQKAESQRAFLDFFAEPKDSPRRKQEGIYHARLFGPADRRVQVILLDTRYFRGPLKKRLRFLPFEGPYEPNPDPKATMLGDAQWQWLEEQLRVPAQLRLLVSSIQVVAEDHHWEKWLNLPHERDRLFKLLRDTQAGGVVILSGDRHLGELSMMDAGIGYPLYDLTSSGMNMGNLKWRKLEVNRHRVATMNQGHNFGLITIAWDRQEPLLSLQICDEVGDIAIQEKIPLRLLRPGVLKSKSTGQVYLADGTPLTPEEIHRNLKKEISLVMTVRATGQSKTGLVFSIPPRTASAPTISRWSWTQPPWRNGRPRAWRRHGHLSRAGRLRSRAPCRNSRIGRRSSFRTQNRSALSKNRACWLAASQRRARAIALAVGSRLNPEYNENIVYLIEENS